VRKGRGGKLFFFPGPLLLGVKEEREKKESPEWLAGTDVDCDCRRAEGRGRKKKGRGERGVVSTFSRLDASTAALERGKKGNRSLFISRFRLEERKRGIKGEIDYLPICISCSNISPPQLAEEEKGKRDAVFL